MRNWDPLKPFYYYTRIHKTGTVRASPPVLLAAGFMALIAVGTLLLSLPMATTRHIGVLSAFFMASSAVTVTGLATIDPATDLTTFGQVVLMLLVQAGGLGFVTFAVLASIKMGKKMSLRHQAVALEAFNQTNVAKVRRTAFSVMRMTLQIELVIITILAIFWSLDMPIESALYLAMFHGITAFNNSGFALFSDSLAGFSGSAPILLTISAAIILGGIGFPVLSDIAARRSWRKLMPYVKIIILATAGLNLAGFALFWLLEANNLATIGPAPWHEQALGAWFLSVTSRTAGFTTFPLVDMRDSSTLVMMLLMFIGGGSLSTASGIKVGTFVVLLAATYSYIKRRKEVVLMGRSISQETVLKSLALVLVTAGLAFLGVLLLSVFEKAPFLTILFEVISALSTTGASRDFTPSLTAPGQILIALLMFAGRLGPLTLVYSIATQQRSRVRYPEAEFQVG